MRQLSPRQRECSRCRRELAAADEARGLCPPCARNLDRLLAVGLLLILSIVYGLVRTATALLP